MILQIQPSGGKWWRLRYRFAGKQMMMGLGTYPDTTLKMAREKRDNARRLLLAADPPIDPSLARKTERNAASSPDTLKAIATEFLEMQTSGAATTTLRRFELHVFPYLGKKPIAKITAAELLAVLKRVEHKGSFETAHRIRSACGRVWRYAIGSGRAEQDIAAAVAGQLAPVNAQHFATITEPKRIGELLRAIDGYSGHYSVSAALNLHRWYSSDLASFVLLPGMNLTLKPANGVFRPAEQNSALSMSYRWRIRLSRSLTICFL